MSDWRFLSRHGNVTSWFKYDEATGEETIETREDAQPLLDMNQKALSNESGSFKGDGMHHMFSVPPTVYTEMSKKIGGNPQLPEFQPAFFKLLNSREYSKLRVKSGRV